MFLRFTLSGFMMNEFLYFWRLLIKCGYILTLHCYQYIHLILCYKKINSKIFIMNYFHTYYFFHKILFFIYDKIHFISRCKNWKFRVLLNFWWFYSLYTNVFVIDQININLILPQKPQKRTFIKQMIIYFFKFLCHALHFSFIQQKM